jgi:hypothetical protein
MEDMVGTVEALVDIEDMEAMVGTVARGRLRPPLLLPLKRMLRLRPTGNLLFIHQSIDTKNKGRHKQSFLINFFLNQVVMVFHCTLSVVRLLKNTFLDVFPNNTPGEIINLMMKNLYVLSFFLIYICIFL